MNALRYLLLAALLWAPFLAPACTSDEGNEPTECQLDPLGCDASDASSDERADDATDALGDDVFADTSTVTDTVEDALSQDTGGEDLGDTETADTRADGDTTVTSLIATQAYEHDVLYGWIVAGQPSEDRLAEVIADGAVILSLRTEGEDPFDEPAYVASLGGVFVRYPTTSTDFQTVSFREGLYDLYDTYLDAGALVYIHCASSGRAGASWALYQGERKGVPTEEAIAMGVAAGLTSLESMVRSILEG